MVVIGSRAELLNNLKPLESLLFALLRGLVVGLVSKRVGQLVEIDLLQKVIDSLGAHFCDKLVGVAVL